LPPHFYSLQYFPPGWINNLEDAKKLAKKEQKLILLNFSGSDWCIPCMRLKKEVFDSEAFTKYAANHLVLVNADFPGKKITGSRKISRKAMTSSPINIIHREVSP